MITDIRELPKRIKAADPRSVWGVVSLIAAIIALAIVARLLVVSAIERDHLQGDLDATRARIAQLQATQETDPSVLRRRIEEAQHELRAVLAGFPTTQQADDEIGRYAQYASELGTQLVRLEAMMRAPEDEVQPAYREQRFLLGVRGDMPQLLRFLGRVSNVPYRGLVVDNITIRPGGAVGDAADGMANADSRCTPRASPSPRRQFRNKPPHPLLTPPDSPITLARSKRSCGAPSPTKTGRLPPPMGATSCRSIPAGRIRSAPSTMCTSIGDARSPRRAS